MDLSVLLFFCAVAVLFGAHVVRCYRQTLLFPDRLLSWRFDLLLGLALSHLINVVLPWRAGDLVRIGYVAMRYRIRASYVGATVVAERLSDIVVVVVLAAVLLLAGTLGPSDTGSALMSAMVLLLGLAGALLALAWAIARSPRVRLWIWRAASIFNERLRFLIVDFGWSYSQLVVNRALLRPAYVLLTAAMWSLYLGSYALFAAASQSSPTEVFLSLVGHPSRPLIEEITGSYSGPQALAMLAFTGLPIIAVLLYGLVRNSGTVMRKVVGLRAHGFGLLAIARPIAGDRFSSRSDYGAFLRAQFTGADEMVSRLGLIVAPDVVVLRLLPGGSDAVTAVVEQAGEIKIRKCAVGDAADKLAVQACWLREQAPLLPLSPVIADDREASVYSFDMPFLLSARDFYEVIHTSPLEKSTRILTEVIDAMDSFHQRSDRGPAASAAIAAYLDQKVVANARLVHAYAMTVFPDGHYTVNGTAYDLADWQVLFDTGWLQQQIDSRRTSLVHGDLTIENIIVSPESATGWYVIDPNPENIFNTPLIDWAKLMQSLHLGYEGLNRAGPAQLDDRHIRLLFTRSGAYAALHGHVSSLLESRLGADVMREIAFHELVNYLRLAPYKIRHQPHKALTFLACTGILLQRYMSGASVRVPPAASLGVAI